MQTDVKKVWPIAEVPPLDEVVVYPKGSQGTVGEVTEEGIKSIKLNVQRLYKAYLENRKTIEEINK